VGRSEGLRTKLYLLFEECFFSCSFTKWHSSACPITSCPLRWIPVRWTGPCKLLWVGVVLLDQRLSLWRPSPPHATHWPFTLARRVWSRCVEVFFSSHFNTESHTNVVVIFIQILCDFYSYTFLFFSLPLQFRLLSFDSPSSSHFIQGVLHLVNTNDGMEHTFQLRGIAERPLAQDYITLHAQAKKRYVYMYINHLSEKGRTRCYSKDNHVLHRMCFGRYKVLCIRY